MLSQNVDVENEGVEDEESKEIRLGKITKKMTCHWNDNNWSRENKALLRIVCVRLVNTFSVPWMWGHSWGFICFSSLYSFLIAHSFIDMWLWRQCNYFCTFSVSYGSWGLWRHPGTLRAEGRQTESVRPSRKHYRSGREPSDDEPSRWNA